jgi:hypothetical protein
LLKGGLPQYYGNKVLFKEGLPQCYGLKVLLKGGCRNLTAGFKFYVPASFKEQYQVKN